MLSPLDTLLIPRRDLPLTSWGSQGKVSQPCPARSAKDSCSVLGMTGRSEALYFSIKSIIRNLLLYPETGPSKAIQVYLRDSDKFICTLPLKKRTSLQDLRKALKTYMRKKSYVFLYPDNIRIHPKQEDSLKAATFGSSIIYIALNKSTSGKCFKAR